MPSALEQIESATTAALFAAARDLRHAESAKRPFPSRFLLESARAMARHVGMNEQRMQDLLPQLAHYQIFLSAAFAADTRNFTEAKSRFPVAYHRICTALGALESHPQLVVRAFHMAAMPLIATLVGNACAEVHDGPLHAMVATRNLNWMRTERWRWTMDAGTFLGGDRGDLRRLVTGLRDGGIERLLILVDGRTRPPAPAPAPSATSARRSASRLASCGLSCR